MCSKRKDTVYREDVINTTNKMLFACDTKSLDDYRDLLVACFEVLPSAQPKPCEDAVSREVISEWLKQYGQDVLHGKYKFSLMYIWKNLMDLPSAQPEQRWIPCSERLPEDGKKHYWVCTDTGYQCECRWTNINHFWTDLTTDWHWHIMDIPQYSAVIAWMPLPEPYREDGNE